MGIIGNDTQSFCCVSKARCKENSLIVEFSEELLVYNMSEFAILPLIHTNLYDYMYLPEYCLLQVSVCFKDYFTWNDTLQTNETFFSKDSGNWMET